MKARPDRGWAGLAGLVVLAVLLAWAAAREFEAGESRRKGDRGSLFHAGSSGCRALFLMMKSEGIDARPLTRPVTAGMAPGLLIVVDPGPELSEDDTLAIESWVRGGGGLLLATDRPARLGERFGVTVKRAPGPSTGLALATPGHPRLGLATGGTTEVDGAGEALFERAGAAQAIEAEDAGSGRAVVVGDVFSTTNAGLDLADNVFVWLDFARDLSAGRPVWFLETVHGHQREPSVMEYVAQAGWGPAALHLLLVTAFVLWLLGARPAPTLAPSTLVRRAAAEYATTMAHLYRRGAATRHAVAVAAAEFDHWLRRPAWLRSLDTLAPAARTAAETEAATIVQAGEALGKRARPDEGSVHAWIARAGRFKGRFARADHE
ncbi:MAG: DUF4350 domain-containing protein [Planctomycetes bacterium]|nr:DUF4350 domain-containing protein [Planctomycetota bacterium]